jgi:tetratricopeptide (TPR) repeat protein
MKVPFQLKRLQTAQPAQALAVFSEDIREMLRLCSRLGWEQCQAIHHLAEGFLIKLSSPSTKAFAGTVRLRSLADNLYIPVDAELIPPLLNDEARDLARVQGLVFLPGNRIWSFDPLNPVTLATLVRAPGSSARKWQPLPDPPRLADRLVSLELDLPQELPEDILDAGGEGLGTGSPRPSSGGVFGKLFGGMAYVVGKGILGLGNLSGLKGIAKAGARMIQSAMTLAPRLSESVLGKQEAALLELLREFREGQLEKALRRALPLGGAENTRGNVTAGDARLPTHNLSYFLSNLLGGRGGGHAIWYGGADVQAELAKEYRKAAEAAIRRGDFRRAAFIYGKLLNNYRLAADALSAGGLHHDAAIIYLKVLDDKRAAARAFAAAGETDRALELYRECREYVLAGDLLKRVGDDEGALTEYRVAADLLALHSEGYLAAGELMLTKAERADLAREYFLTGWSKRPHGNAVACALYLARQYADGGSGETLLDLTSEADGFFLPCGNEVVSTQFYNAMAKLAEHRRLTKIKDELRDRALLGIAHKLRQKAAVESRPGNTVSQFLGQAKVWLPALVSDADFAFRKAVGPRLLGYQPERAKKITTRSLGLRNAVTATCFAPESGFVFLANHSGELMCYESADDRVVPLVVDGGDRISAITTDSTGGVLVALSIVTRGPELICYCRRPNGIFECIQRQKVQFKNGAALTPSVCRLASSDWAVGYWNGEELEILKGAYLIPHDTRKPSVIDHVHLTMFLRPFHANTDWPVILWFEGDAVWLQMNRDGPLHRARIGWPPLFHRNRFANCVPLTWRNEPAKELELAGLTNEGAIYYSQLAFDEEQIKCLTTQATKEDGFQAVTFIRENVVASVKADTVHFFRCGPAGITTLAKSRVPLARVIACYPCHQTQELLVIDSDATIARLPLPV